jgi:hypothetical protein
LRKVAQEPLSEIKKWVDQQVAQKAIATPEDLAKRNEWALNSFGHNALGYACWFKDGIELQETLHYLTTVIKVPGAARSPRCSMTLTLLSEQCADKCQREGRLRYVAVHPPAPALAAWITGP